MEEKQIQQAVRKKYSEVALTPSCKFQFPTGRDFALSCGYPQEMLDSMPSSAVESFAGTWNTMLQANVKEGEYVLDLGCGAGLDALIASKAAGSNGKVFGVDFAPEMIKKSKLNAINMGISNVEFIETPAGHLPFRNNFFDVVVSNGILNLNVKKEPILAEVYRVLKAKGRFILSEIVLTKEVANQPKDLEDWFR